MAVDALINYVSFTLYSNDGIFCTYFLGAISEFVFINGLLYLHVCI